MEQGEGALEDGLELFSIGCTLLRSIFYAHPIL